MQSSFLNCFLEILEETWKDNSCSSQFFQSFSVYCISMVILVFSQPMSLSIQQSKIDKILGVSGLLIHLVQKDTQR